MPTDRAERAVRPVTDADMPQLFLAADRASLDAQARFVNGTRLRLALVVLSALLTVTAWRVGSPEIDVLAVGSTVLFVGALVLEGLLWSARPDRTWYDARAVAESAKTLAWKFAVRGEPFLDHGVSEADATRRLVERLEEVRGRFQDLDLAPVDAESVTAWMHDERRARWEDRRQLYLIERIRQEKAWYADRARYNQRRSSQWRGVLVSLELLGVVASLLAAFVEDLPLIAPALAAMVGAGAAWMETKQHQVNARAYTAAVADLAQAEAKLKVAASEHEWAKEVRNAEDAISREHTLWLASRAEM